uniref:Glutathione s-transferase n=1 Tax=Melanopsichium pennsylvanicum 4 TaxID=1398559 RepID=A0A077QQI5_9BASI|nr:glutathione s-transferase [Melanopsichium pennsylvanicum 4]
MTTPDRAGPPEDLGVVEIFGAPFSTFTRSITLGLHELGIHHIAITRAPHSEDIKAKNPYGLLPVLVHRPDGLYTKPDEIVTLYESNAIRRYIDEYLAPIVQHSSNKELLSKELDWMDSFQVSVKPSFHA